MQQFEKLGKFYLGREVDSQTGESEGDLLLYDSSDLTTHAVCVGMTGSGKTGLCIGLLEEAAIDSVPSIIIDPKGDLSNLLLTFPGLSTEEFLPWINPGEASGAGLSEEEYAKSQAELWRKGLSSWGQDAERISRLKNSADFAIYTPGSSSGRPVSILSSFSFPGDAVSGDPDLLRERINTTVTSLLNLLDIDADPIRSREHILLSNIFENAWRDQEDLGLESLIRGIQDPPFKKVGVFELESFFPANDRFELAMILNNLLAAPGFHSWLEGDSLDVDRFLFTDSGKPRVSIFSISHLDNAQRMFFVSLLLTQILGWVRGQQGTSSLRAILYMDEVFGYFPPVANPPSKLPLMTLLKQARAYGLGIVLATQNPADLDYKGLSNTGTWFIGRLQTRRDRDKMLDGLESVEGSAGGRFDRKQMEKIVSGLDKRVFLMNNIHEDHPVLFRTRWVLSYLRGPLTRAQIKRLTKKAQTESTKTKPVTGQKPEIKLPRPGPASAALFGMPVLPPSIHQCFLPASAAAVSLSTIVYQPALLAAGVVYFSDARSKTATERRIVRIIEFPSTGLSLDWAGSRELEIAVDDLEKIPEEHGSYGKLPETAAESKNYTAWGKEFKDWLYRNEVLSLYYSPSLKISSRPGETERDFRIRIQLEAHELRDQLAEKLRKKYSSKIISLQDRVKKAELRVQREQEQASQQKLQTAISVGTALFSALTGRKTLSRSTLGRASTAAGRAGRIFKEGKDVERARESLGRLEERLAKLQNVLEEEISSVESSIDPATEKLETKIIKPRKSDISVSLAALAWVPYQMDSKY